MSMKMLTKTNVKKLTALLLSEWDFEKNDLAPDMVTPMSHKKVWWKCSKGHRWMARVTDRNRGSGCPYCAGMLPIKGETDLATVNPTLAAEWDYEKNELTPDMVMPYSRKKVWWKCSKGHSWLAKIDVRNLRSGCPYCNGKLPIKGETDLATVNPALAAEWDYEKNDITPDMVTPGAGKKVWWRCKENHSWLAGICDRNQGSGCPYCYDLYNRAKRYNCSLAKQNPSLVEEWDYEKNELTPDMVTPMSHKKVWWKCSHGHSWLAGIYARNRGSGCPYCAGMLPIKGETDLATVNPTLAAEWDYEKNELTPDMVMPYSRKKVWWKCSHGHSWLAMIADRNLGSGCPYCYGKLPIKGETDLATVNPTLASEWDYEKNDITPDMVLPKSKKKVWWKCSKGHSSEAQIAKRSRGDGCPYCCKRIAS